MWKALLIILIIFIIIIIIIIGFVTTCAISAYRH